MKFEEIMNACGGIPAVAKYFGIRDWAVRKWGKTQIPANRCKKLAELSNGKVHESDMRPDLWDKPEKSAN